MARLRDIAALAGVNVSTVSKALRGKDDVNPQTRDRVIEVARRLNYVRRVAPRAESDSRPQGIIGLLCPEIRSGYYANIVTTMEGLFRRNGFSMLLGLTDFSHQREAAVLDELRRQTIRGIVCVTENDRIEKDLRTFRNVYSIPVVLVATVIAIEDFDYVKVNDELGVRLAVGHFEELGHTRIGFIGDNVSQRRRVVFGDTLKKRGIELRQDYVRMGPERFELGGYLRMKELLSERNPPTAVLAAYDDFAIGALRAIDEAGLSVPGDISIVGIDGLDVGGYLPTSLTSVGSDTAEMARAAVRILLKKIAESSFTVVQHVEVNPQLVVRQSSGAPRSALRAGARPTYGRHPRRGSRSKS